MGLASVAIYSEDEAHSLHLRHANDTIKIPGKGASAYLDLNNIMAAAKATGADALHPGYGFLSENAEFARQCANEGIIFIGPRPDTLSILGDKAAARALAEQCGVPVVPGSNGPTTLAQTKQFIASQTPRASVVIKAISGGGGRGMRIVPPGDDVEAAYQACAREAKAAFGDDALYVERLVPKARHIEVQVLGDGNGNVVHFGERECSLQRRNQKLIEIAPSPTLADNTRQQLLDAALTMAKTVNYLGLGTFEFLVAPNGSDYFFMEANPRLQVEHTITEEITGIDLVQSQIAVSAGIILSSLRLTQEQIPAPSGFATQCLLNMATIDTSGATQPSGGTLQIFAPPTGPGVRVDTFGYSGYTTSPPFDSLLAKVITHSRSSDYTHGVRKAYRALCQFRIEGVATNIPFLQTLLSEEDVAKNNIYTKYVDEHLVSLVANSNQHPQLFPTSSAAVTNNATSVIEAPAGTETVTSPMQGQLVATLVNEGDTVTSGQVLAIVEAMKMEHEIKAPTAGIIRALPITKDDIVSTGQALVFIQRSEEHTSELQSEESIDLDHIRPDLAEFFDRERL